MSLTKPKYAETNKVEIEKKSDITLNSKLHRVDSTASWISATVSRAVNNGELSNSCKVLYYVICFMIIIAIASVQVFMTRANENNLLSIQSEHRCASAFELVESAWSQSKLFAESIASGLSAVGLDFSKEEFESLGISVAVKSVKAAESFQFVKHLHDNSKRRAYETQIRAELNDSSFIIHSFNQSVEFPYLNDTVYDPIIYSSHKENTFVPGFFPYPELPRDAAIQHTLIAGETSCSAPVYLVGQISNPIGVLVFVPMFTINNRSTHNFSEADDIFGFVNCVFKIDTLFDHVLEGAELHDVSLFLYDDNEYLGRWPSLPNITGEHIDGMNINDQTRGCLVTYEKTIEVGSRDWHVTCCLAQSFVDEKRSLIPFLIFGLSILISTTFNGLKFIVKKLLLKAEKKFEETRANTVVESRADSLELDSNMHKSEQ